MLLLNSAKVSEASPLSVVDCFGDVWPETVLRSFKVFCAIANVLSWFISSWGYLYLFCGYFVSYWGEVKMCSDFCEFFICAG